MYLLKVKTIPSHCIFYATHSIIFICELIVCECMCARKTRQCGGYCENEDDDDEKEKQLQTIPINFLIVHIKILFIVRE